MIYLSFIFIIYSIALTYKKLKNMNTIFLYGLIGSWFISFFSYLFYLTKFNVYSDLIREFYSFNKGTWNYLVTENLNSIVLIRLLNFGVLLFDICFLLFALSFVIGRSRINRLYYYLPLLILFFIQLCYYDPYVQLKLQNYFLDLGYESGIMFNKYTHFLDSFFQIIKFAQFILAFGLLIYYLIKNFSVHFIRQYTFYHIMCLFPISIIHLIMFSWAPEVLIRATVITSYHNFLRPQMNLLFDFKIFMIITLIAFAAMIFAFSKYHNTKKQHFEEAAEINMKIKTASLGIKAFTHSIKNHLLAIRSETEYLKEKFADDPETLYSLELILKSSYYSYDIINNASDKLNTIEIVLKPVKLHIPVEQAINKLSTKEQDLNIEVVRLSKGSKALMDEKQITEVCLNIIKNAIEAMHMQQNKQITITVEDQDKWGCITITDNGPGIQPEYINDIFSPFFSTKSSTNNWGVGLSYCHKMVSKHQGKIEVTSHLDVGTTFKILLPLH